MEGSGGVRANALLTGTESPEVLGRFGDDIFVKLHHYPPFHLSSNAYVQEAPRVHHSLSPLSHSSLSR